MADIEEMTEELEIDDSTNEETDDEHKTFDFSDGTSLTIDDIGELKEWHDNNEQWKDANNKRAEEVKKDRTEFKDHQAKETERLKQREQKLREQEQKVSSRDQQQQEQSYYEKVTDYSNNQNALLDMRKKYDDYDTAAVNEFMKGFNVGFGDYNAYDVHRLMYLAWRGSQQENEVQRAREDMVKEMKNKKGTPASGIVQGVSEEPVKTKEDFLNRVKGLITW